MGCEGGGDWFTGDQPTPHIITSFSFLTNLTCITQVFSDAYIAIVPVTLFASVTTGAGSFHFNGMSNGAWRSGAENAPGRTDLEERLIQFGVAIIRTGAGMAPNPAGIHLSRQLLRSGTSPALNYAEAKAAESHRDFTHKMKLALKELRETWVNLRLVHGAELHPNGDLLRSVLAESSELVAIFTQSVRTAERKSPPKN